MNRLSSEITDRIPHGETMDICTIYRPSIPSYQLGCHNVGHFARCLIKFNARDMAVSQTASNSKDQESSSPAEINSHHGLQ